MIWASSPQRGTWWIGPLTRKNYAHKYDLTKVLTAGTFVNWPPDSKKLRSKVWFDEGVRHRPLAQLAHCSSENIRHMRELKRVVSPNTPLEWPSDSWKLLSKVWFEQVCFRNELFKLAPWLEKTTLISMIWPVFPQRAHLYRMRLGDVEIHLQGVLKSEYLYPDTRDVDCFAFMIGGWVGMIHACQLCKRLISGGDED